MALVYLRNEATENGKGGYVINTKNIETFLKLENRGILIFRVYLMNGENYDFNQIHYQGDFIFVHNMEQLYSLLTKLDSGVIQDGSS